MGWVIVKNKNATSSNYCISREEIFISSINKAHHEPLVNTKHLMEQLIEYFEVQDYQPMSNENEFSTMNEYLILQRRDLL